MAMKMKSAMKGKKPLNEYFKAMLKAKKSGAASFVYKGST